MNEINFEAALNKLLDDIYIMYRGVRIEKSQGGFIVFGGWYSKLEAAQDRIDFAYPTLFNSLKKQP